MRRALPSCLACLACFAVSACTQPRADVPAPLLASPEAAQPAAARYLALGDSFTIGTGSPPSLSFPARLVARWGSGVGACVSLKNLGVNGFTTQSLIDVELPEVPRFAPTLVTLAIGANDIVRGRAADDYRAQVRRILAAVISAGVPAKQIVVLPQPDWSRSPAAASFGDLATLVATIETFNTILSDEAAGAGARYVDLFPLMQREAQRGMIAADGLHPSADAYDEWAAALAAAIPSPCAR